MRSMRSARVSMPWDQKLLNGEMVAPILRSGTTRARAAMSGRAQRFERS